ncbi:MAG: flagellar hook-associated protein FlgL [Bacillota bacterium]|nr:flagellar hook-associated protein FlgL [Bacillota bacterium]
MRITNNMMTNMLLHNLNRNVFNMSRLQEQGTDGKRIHRPSDDPIGISKILKFKTDLSDLEQYESNIRDALNWYQVSESSVEDMSAAIKRIRELSVQAANTATNSPEDLQKIKAEVMQLRDHIISAGNFSYAGKYVFSGYQNDKPLFKTEIINGKKVVSYNIDITHRDISNPQKMRYEVGQAEQIQVTTNGVELFGILNPEDKKHKLSVNFDANQDYSAKDITLLVGNEKFVVQTRRVQNVNGEEKIVNVPFTTKDEIERAFASATNANGRKLSSLAKISFDGGKLSIEAKDFDNKRIEFETLPAGITNPKAEFSYNQNVYGNMYSDTSGNTPGEGISSIQTRFDRSRDYTNENLNIRLSNGGVGINYEVDETLLNGTQTALDKALLLERYRNAKPPAGSPAWAGTKLSDVADVSFDEHNNLVITAKNKGVEVAPQDPAGPVKFASSQMGVSSKKAELKGDFILDGPLSDYRNSTLSYTLDAGKPGQRTFQVDMSQLTGHGFNLKKEKVLEEIRSADDGHGNKLSDYADVFFDRDGKLVVKHKEYGSDHSVSATFNPGGSATADSYKPVQVPGVDKVESKVSFSAFNGFDDQYIRDHAEELKTNSIFISYNGERKEIVIDKDARLDSVADYKTALQDAINKTIGENKIVVGPRNTPTDPTSPFTNDAFLSFQTINTKDGVPPQIQVEPVVASKSSLIADIDKFISALDSYDQDTIDQFMGKIDGHLDRVLSVRADVGAKTNRMELAIERTKDNALSFTKSLSKVEDVDLAATLMKLKNFENAYRASLSMGSKIIQPSLVDFIR